jgi:hypothetical protein
MRYLLPAILTTGLLAACTGADDGGKRGDPDGSTSLLRLSRSDDGTLEYCDPEGECSTLPYGGDCEIIEIRIDTSSGSTCERCILADGTTEDHGCDNAVVACTVVTVPEPDCVVCAYVSGAVIYSSCEPSEPVCLSDADCGADARCEAGLCVPRSGQCFSDAECPSGFVCELDCLYDCAEEGCGAPAQMDPSWCEGWCTPAPYDPCAAVECAPGYRCEEVCYAEAAEPQSSDALVAPACEATCVASACESNADCELGEVCETICADCAPTDGDCWAPCTSECVPGYCPLLFVCADGSAPRADCTCPEDLCPYYILCTDGSIPRGAECECPPEDYCPLDFLCQDGSQPLGRDCECPGDICAVQGLCPDGSAPRGAGCICPCHVGGCSGEICADEPMVSDCMARPEHACFTQATCERQADGHCAWTETDALLACLADPE